MATNSINDKEKIVIFLLYCLLLQPLYGEHNGVKISVAN